MSNENHLKSYSADDLVRAIGGISSIVSEAIVLIRDRHITYISSRAMEILGVSDPKEVLGKSTRMFYFNDNDYQTFGQQHYKQMEEDGFSSGIINIKRLNDGHPLQISIHNKMLDTNPINIVSVFKENQQIIDNPLKVFLPAAVDFEQKSSEFKQIVDSLNVAVLTMDADGTVDYTNPYMDNIIATHPKGIGTKCYEICDHIWSESATDFCSWCRIDEVIKNGSSPETMIKSKEGKRWHFSWAPLFDKKRNILKIVKTIADVTEIMAVKSHMENLLLDIFVTLPVGILMLNGKSKIIFINTELEKRWGLSFREISMEILDDLEVYQNDATLSLALKDLRKGQRTDSVEVTFIRYDDLKYTIRVSLIPLIKDDFGWQGVLVEEDITEIVEAKKQIEKNLASREKMLVEQEKLAAVGQLAAGIGHELNTPTTYVRGNMQLFVRYAGMLTSLLGYIEGEDSYEQRKVAVNKMEDILLNVQEIANSSFEGTTQIMNIISSMRSFVQHQNSLNDTVDLYTPILDAITLVFNRVKYVGGIVVEGVTFNPGSSDFIKPKPLMVKGNATRLGQLFVIILNNAIDAWHNMDSPPKEPFQLDIHTQQTGKTLNIMLTDNCGGIQANITDKIFDPFFTTKSSKEGTGLGLSIARQIVSEHGGSLVAKNSDNGGTVFLFKIPMI